MLVAVRGNELRDPLDVLPHKGYEVADQFKALSDEARVLINQVLGTPIPVYEQVGSEKKMSYVSVPRGFGTWTRDAQMAHLHILVQEEILAPHESLAVQDAMFEERMADTIPFTPATEDGSASTTEAA